MAKSANNRSSRRTVERRASRSVRHERLVDLLSVGEAHEPAIAAMRREQLREMVKITHGTQLFSLFTAGLMALELRRAVDPSSLGLWMAAMLLLASVRLFRARSLKPLLDLPVLPRALPELSLFVVFSGILWIIPAFFWSSGLPQRDQIIVGMVLFGLMCIGATSLRIVPLPALAFVAIVSAGQMRMAFGNQSLAVVLLAAVFPLNMCQSIVASARLFVRQSRARGELEEQGQLISLLREFQSSGSDWLWELDSELKIRYLSEGMAKSIGRRAQALVGANARTLIDPDRRQSMMSEGTRALFAAIGAGQAFQEIAFPTINGKRWYSVSGRPVRDANGVVTGWRGVASDITHQRTGAGTDGVKVARRDPLTGLANRLLVREMIEEARLRQRAGDGGCVLLLLDLDRFKLVNDTLGHAVGDLLLVDVARRISAICGDEGGVARLGGDEFAIVWRGRGDTLTLVTLADAVIDSIAQGFNIGASAIHVGVSIGIARAPADGETQDQLMRCADLALYRAKDQGRGRCAFYEPWMLAKAKADRLLENDVHDAVRRSELRLAYQPILHSISMEVMGYEALLRWSHPQRGSISPEVFIPIIEDVGLIHQIGDWVIREACREAVTWPNGLRIAVNVSVSQLTAVGLRQTVEEALRETGLEAERLELEVTENVFIGDDARTLAALSGLQALGVRLVLDDFGKGYSSLGYLSRAYFAKIKIDQLFVRAASNGQRESLAIVNAILALAKGLGVETTAEGVETTAQADLMAALGCSQLQGFLFGRPVSAEMVRRLRSERDQVPALIGRCA